MCICMRIGTQLWVERDRVAHLQQLLQQSIGQIFVSFENQTINTADIAGTFSAETMGELTMRKNGTWQCSFSEWHKRGEDCNCPDQKLRAMYEERRNISKACQVSLGEGHRGVLVGEGKNISDRLDCNVEVTKPIAEWEPQYELYHGFYRDMFG